MDRKFKFFYLLGLFASSYLLFKMRRNSKKCKYTLLYKKSKINKLFNLFSDNLNNSYSPTIYLGSGHIQTFLLEIINILLSLIKKFIKFYQFTYKREIFNLSDGGIIGVDHCIPINPCENSDRIMIVIPGYTSNSEDYYIKSFSESFINDFEVRILNMRGISEKLTTPKMISWECYLDVGEYINKTCQQNPYKNVYCVGFSFGGTLLCRYLGTNPDSIPSNFICGAGICYPTDFEQAAKKCEENFRGFYSKIAVRNLKACFFENIDVIFDKNLASKHVLEQKYTIIESVSKANFVSEFEDAYTRRILEFDNLSSYYNASNICNHISNIKKPFFSIFTIDDPIIPYESLPFKIMELNQNLVSVASTNGGHLAFFSGIIPERWISTPIKTFIHAAEYFVENNNLAKELSVILTD